MAICLSFVNQVFTPELRIGVLDLQKNQFHWIIREVPWSSEGATGIQFNKNKDRARIYVCFQNAGLAVFDKSFNPLQFYDFKFVKDPHALKLFEGELFVVSTGTNQIAKITLNPEGLVDSEEIFWCYPETDNFTNDMVHLNSMAFSDSGIYVTGFGERVIENSWEKAENGFLMDITAGRKILQNLKQPHSAYACEKGLILCESCTGRILYETGGVLTEVGGYTRGLLRHGDMLIVGCSARRKISKSKKRLVTGRIGNFENHENRSSKVSVIEADSLKTIKEIDFSFLGNEIFDLMDIEIDKNEMHDFAEDAKEIRIRYTEENFYKWIRHGEIKRSEEDKKLSDVKERLAYKSSELESLKIKYRNKIADLKKHERSAEKNKKDLELSKRKIESLKHEKTELLKAINELKLAKEKEKKELHSLIEKRDRKIVELKETIDDVIRNRDARYSEMERKIEIQLERMRRLESVVLQKKEKVEMLKEDFEKRLENREESIRMLKRNLAVITENRNKAVVAIKYELSGIIRNRDDKIKLLKCKIDELKENISQIVSNRNKRIAKMDSILAEKSDKLKELVKIKNQFDESQKYIASLENRISNYTGRIKILIEKNEEYKAILKANGLLIRRIFTNIFEK